MEPSKDEAKPSGHVQEGSIAKIEHMPRKKASGPRFDALPEYRSPTAPQPPITASPYPADAVARVAALKEPRFGPVFVKYSSWAGGAAVLYTYLAGFRHLMQKDRASWQNTFRQRVFILSPLFAMYAAGSGLLPMPFRTKWEEQLGRPAISLLEFDKADKARLKALKEAAQAAEAKAVDAATDALIAKAS